MISIIYNIMNDFQTTCACLLLPFFATLLGVVIATFLPNVTAKTKKALLALSAGVMLCASIFSLLYPAVTSSTAPFFTDVIVGYFLGAGLIILLQKRENTPNATNSQMATAITLHNFPEGLSVGVALAFALQNDLQSSAFAFAISIAIQNLPEGFFVSASQKALEKSNKHAFLLGLVSATVELCGALVAIAFSWAITRFLPLSLAFSAGAMMFVTQKELLCECNDNPSSAWVLASFLAMLFFQFMG